MFNDLLKKQNLSQTELAKKVGVSVASVNMWCSGKRKMSMKTLIKVSKALNVSVQKVLDNLEIKDERI